MSIGSKIAHYRKTRNLTQDALAKLLDVTNQAVSKWESDQCCPDIQLLPRLADVFGITIDELFDRAPKSGGARLDLPWPDDRTLRAVLFQGHTLLKNSLKGQDLVFAYEGPALNVSSMISVRCGNVQGNVDAGNSVSCGCVGGDVDAGSSVACTDVGGNVDAGDRVDCANVGGDVDAGSSITCADVGGDVDAGGNAQCGNVEGDVDAGGNVTCGSVGGDIDAGGSVTIRK